MSDPLDIIRRLHTAAFLVAINREIEERHHPYVVWDGSKVPLMADYMKEAGLTNGQVIDDGTFARIEPQVKESINSMIIEWHLRREFGEGAGSNTIV